MKIRFLGFQSVMRWSQVLHSPAPCRPWRVCLFICCMVLAVHGSTIAQGPGIEITPAAAPAKVFTAEVPDRSLWRIRVNRLNERDGEAADDESSKISARQIKEIEVAYGSGLRREISRYGNKRETIQYIARGLLIHLDPATQELLFDDPADRAMRRVSGLDRWGELLWVSPRYFIGTALYNERQCDVYRQFFQPLQPGEEFIEGIQGISAGELNGQAVRTLMTAYIDSETSLPIALENGYETLIYERLTPYEPFSLPQNVREAVQLRNEALKRREQRFNISK